MICQRLQVAGALYPCTALRVGARCMSASIPYPKQPYRKQLLQRSREEPVLKWRTFSAPSLLDKYIRHADRVATELGVAAELKDFNEKAAAFPKPPTIRVVTILERANVVMRELEDWENDFIEFVAARKQACAKRYPQTLIDMITASSTVVEGGDNSGGDNFSNIGASATGEVPNSKSGGAKSSKKADSASPSDAAAGADTSASKGLSTFYEKGSSRSASASTEENTGVMTEASRTSVADSMHDVKSLDRAYDQRLILLLSNGGGGWGFPSGDVREGETLVAAAKRSLLSQVSSDLDVWYVGNSPIGHQLRVYSAEEQERNGCYGEKVFYYRAEILAGRIKSGDFAWVTRDESESYLERPLYKYAHQIMGGGPGEEFARRKKWLESISSKGLTPAQATGRRAHRVKTAKLARVKLPALATAKQTSLAALQWADSSKSAGIAAEASLLYAQKQQQQKHARMLQAQLAIPSAATIAANARAARQMK